MMISPQDADRAFADAEDLGDCNSLLAERFPDATAADRIDAIREAHRRVTVKFFGGKKRREKPRSKERDGI